MTLAPGSYFDEARANHAIRFFESLKLTEGQFYGQPFKLLPWQRKIVSDVYGTLKEDGTRQYQYVWLELPKKNGKSGLASAAALYHLFADGEQRGAVYSVATDRSNASIVFDAAFDMWQMIPALKKRGKPRYSIKKIEDRVSKTVYSVMSSDAYSKHGYKPSAVMFDEIHAQPDRELWDVMTFGSGSARRQPIWWNMTTAGNDPDRVSIGWELHEHAEMVANGERIDPSWYVSIYAYDGDDIYNEKNWYKANPSLGTIKSLDAMRTDAAKAKFSGAQEQNFRWLHLNQWITTKLSSWLPLDVFDQTVGTLSLDDLDGKDCFIGLDASTTTDLSAIALIFPPQAGLAKWQVFWRAWIPGDNMLDRIKTDHVPYNTWANSGWVRPTEGNVIDHWAIRDYILSLKAKFNIVELVADPAFATMLNQELIKQGVNVVTVKGDYVNMTDPINMIETLLKSGEMEHERNDLARWTFGNTSLAMNGSGLKKPVKQTKGKRVIRTKRIDPMVALFLAMQRARFYAIRVDVNEQIKAEGWGM